MRIPSQVAMSPQRMDRIFASTPRDIDYVLDRREPLVELLRDLPPGQREAVKLFFIDDLPADEVARRLGVTGPQLTALLAEARQSLRAEARRRFPTLCANGNGARR